MNFYDYQIKCKWCDDAATNYAVDKNGIRVIVFCDCEAGISSKKFYSTIRGKESIEVWFDGLKGLGFTREKIPTSFFAPEKKELTEGEFISHRESTLEKYKRLLAESNEYWRELQNGGTNERRK